MFEKAMMLYIYAETPMHPGSGALVNSPVDLPIQRERHTEYPMIQGSSLKGVLKGHSKNAGFTDEDIKRVFGPEKGDEGAGAIAVTDGRILAFPVRILAGAFGWVICPTVLTRFKRDLANTGLVAKWEIPELTSNNSAIVPVNSRAKTEGSVYVEDFRLPIDGSKNISDIASEIQSCLSDEEVYKPVRSKLARDLILVSDEVFKDLVKYTTEVTARIRIDPEKGTAAETALFYEEYLPTDTLMYALVIGTNRASDEDIRKLKNLNGQVIQIGANETVGRGFAKLKVVTTDAKKP